MKKIFLVLVIALLTISCSSDDDVLDPTQGLTQYEVDIPRPKQNINPFLYRKSDYGTVLIAGRSGVWIFYNEENSFAFDSSCPVEWSEGKTGTLDHPIDFENNEISCDNCNSKFNYSTKQAVSGKAKDLGYKLVTYKVTYDSVTKYYHITNPNYN